MGNTAIVTGVGRSGRDVPLPTSRLAWATTVVGTVHAGRLRSRLRTIPSRHGRSKTSISATPRHSARLLDAVRQPDEIYNLAAISQVSEAWAHPDLTHEVNAVAVDRMLDVMLEVVPRARVFQASTSEVYGTRSSRTPRTSRRRTTPDNAYAESKSRAHLATVERRERQRHVSPAWASSTTTRAPLRGVEFVTRRITRAAAEIAAGRRDRVTLGNLEAARDWGAARDYVVAMHAALQHDEPGDYTIATGRLHTLRELVDVAFAAAGVDDPWSRVEHDPDLLRQADSPGRCRRSPDARASVLGWEATTSFEDLVAEMVRVDEARVRTGVEESVEYLTTGAADA